ncbi:MAG: ROK family transcriptional regulator [Propionibacteriaceae bacterium]|nr:ROK family transcriptional regulator [Propionibacteriaceae bacterium]
MPRKEATPLSSAATTRVLDALRDAPEAVSVTELVQSTALSRPTIQAALLLFRDLGWLRITQRPSNPGLGGRPAEAYQFDGAAAQAVAARICRSEVVATLLDAAGTEVRRIARPIPDPSAIVPTLQSCLDDVLAENASAPALIVVATLGICHDGAVLESATFPMLQGHALPRRLSRHYGVRVTFANDAKLSALAQLRSLSRADPDLSLVAIHVDQSPGCGLVVHHRILDGAHGAAGELAFGSTMSWHDMERALREAANAHGCVPVQVFTAAAAGDPWAVAAMESVVDLVAEGVVNLVLAIDPHVVSLSGPGAIPGLWEERLAARLRPRVPRLPEIVVVEDEESVLTGARLETMAALHASRLAQLENRS